MSTTPTVKREIKLNENLVKVLNNLNADLKNLQEQMKPIAEKLQAKDNEVKSLIAGVCLNEGMDLTNEAIYFNETLDTIFIYDQNPVEVVDVPQYPPMKATRKKKS